VPRDRITLVPTEKRIRVVTGEATVADSTATLLLLETGHRPVYYFPRDDVRMDLLTPTNHRTTCQYKGDASYFSLKVDGRTVENAVWSYEQPIADMEPIAQRFAFYWDRGRPLARGGRGDFSVIRATRFTAWTWCRRRARCAWSLPARRSRHAPALRKTKAGRACW
jgi:uncharacterized protein (DUF427 family)